MEMFLDSVLDNAQIQLLKIAVDDEFKKRRPMLDKGLTTVIDNEENFYRFDPTMGRLLMEMFPTPKEIIDHTQLIVDKTFPGYKYEATTFCEYSELYGKPLLSTHIDNANATLCFDYQLDSNISWPILIEDKGYSLKDNDAILFKSGEVKHGRTNLAFQAGQYSKMLFFFFKRNDA